MQVYIITGGWDGGNNLGSTEIMLKEGGTAWQQVADLPSARYGLRGVGLDNGKFLVTGWGSNLI